MNAQSFLGAAVRRTRIAEELIIGAEMVCTRVVTGKEEA